MQKASETLPPYGHFAFLPLLSIFPCPLKLVQQKNSHVTEGDEKMPQEAL